MTKKPKIWQILIFLVIIIILFRLSRIIFGLKFIWLFFLSIIQADFDAFSILDLQLIDILVSILLILIIPIIIFATRNKFRLFQFHSDLYSTFLILILFAFVFAPLMTNINPNFQKDLRITKTLPPLSSVKILHLKNIYQNRFNGYVKELLLIKNKIVKQAFDESIIFVDSINVDKKVEYYQQDQKYEIDIGMCELENNKVKISSFRFYFGTDEFGRDIFTRIIYGSRTSLSISLGSLLIILILGVGFGFLSGLKGGVINIILTRISELFLSFPSIFLVILIIALFNNSILTIIIIFGITGWMSLFKIVKSEVVAMKSKDFIISSRKIGLPEKSLLFNEILPVIASPILVSLIIQSANIVLAESSLSFLGLGAGVDIPSWGAMIQSGQNNLYHAWWMLIFPSGILVALLFSVNELGQRVNIYLNPRAQKND